MASVKSLGLHQPTALHRTIEELGLPQSTNLSALHWEINTDKRDTPAVEDELLVTETCVVWSRGGIFRKSFKFDLENEPITQALLAYFPAYDELRKPKNKKRSSVSPEISKKPSKALIVFLKTQAHLHFVSGASHVIHMPFEVEAACAAPQGVIIQRKHYTENNIPVSLKFPKVPPNSFVSSQITAPSLQGSQQTTFSIEGLGNPRSLPLNLGSTLEDMWEVPLGNSQSKWPRLVTLVDPLQDIGLVVTDPQSAQRAATRRGTSKSPYLLDPAEEILYIEEIQLPSLLQPPKNDPLILAVTVNREANTYTLWRLSYNKNGDDPVQRSKKSDIAANRRRSSMQPQFASGASTPIQVNFRESFGAPLPGKRQRKSERLERLERTEKSDKPLDLVSSLNADKDGGATRRQSRRVSSMLARADLSASQERSAFSEQQLMPNLGSSIRDSFGTQGGRHSLNYNQTIHPSLGSLLEAPIDNVLDELRAGGDFEGFHSMGLDDHDCDGLAQEVVFTKVHTIDIDSSNVRYSVSSQPARYQSGVFILSSPKLSVDDNQRSELILGIQDAVDKKLQLLTIDIHKGGQFLVPPRSVPPRSSQLPEVHSNALRITCGQLRRAHPVVDACKVVDGDLSAILILSEGNDGRRELSIQAPWLEKTPITLPRLLLENERSLQYIGRVIDRDVRQRRSEALDTANGIIRALRYSRMGGIVDVVDAERRHHQIQIQLQPRNPLARKVLDACRSVLPSSQSKKILPGWWQAMMWLQAEDMQVADTEWSALVIHIMSIFLVLGGSEAVVPAPQRPVKGRRRPPSGSFGSMNNIEDWRSLQLHETPNALGCPIWQQNRGWDWTADHDDDLDTKGDFVDCKFLPTHIQYTKAYLASSIEGDLPRTAYALSSAILQNTEDSHSAVWAFFIGLHLLLEEQKLDTSTPEYATPGIAELRVLMAQIARWLRWHEFASYYEMGLQEELENRYDNVLTIEIPPPQSMGKSYDVIEWISTNLTGGDRTDFLTLAFARQKGVPDSSRQSPTDTRWGLMTPRTHMFKRFFSKLRARNDAVGLVEAMYSSGIDVRMLETLPEAILTPLRDAMANCQARPPSSWSKDMLKLVGRSDITLMYEPSMKLRQRPFNIIVRSFQPSSLAGFANPPQAPIHIASWDFRTICQTLNEFNSAGYDDGEGTERQAVIRALFKEDRRLNEAQDLLSTHRPRIVHLDPEPGWTESQYLEKQKELVSRVATGTLAIPAGRALLYYGLRHPLLTQKFHIGGFNLNCIVRPTNVTVGVDRSQFTEEKVCWGFFHQGVAAGLAISSQAKGIDTSWILFNKPGQDLNNRHAGFLLALGLNGHLKDVAKWVAFKYLTPKHTMTSIGLLLGLAASYLGTMDSLITRLLSVHVTRMLPRGAAELNISPLTQTTGIMGIGLLYCGSQHRRMSEIMMSEIEHVGEDESPEPLRSECYRLAAGFSLGFINLGKGKDLKGLHDMRLTEKLIGIATANKKVEMVQILDRAAAGAVMALALIFMKSEDHIVARKIDVPESVLQFDYIRPDILLLRTVAKNLILWSQIEPSFEWIAQSLPTPFRFRHGLTGTIILKSTDLPFFSILAGLCFSLALRFAGSGSLKARDILIHYLDQFMRVSRIVSTKRVPQFDRPIYDEELARSNAHIASLRTHAGPDFWDVELDLKSDATLLTTMAKNPSLFLKRRPPLEAPFSATLRALGRSSLADAHARRGPTRPFGGNAAMDGSLTVTSAVDTRLVLEQSAKSFSRERLQGLKLLFRWADVRDRVETRKVAPAVANGLQKPGQRQEEFEGKEEAKEEGEGWWIRNSVIEALKGQVFLAVRVNVEV
ncbi:PC_rep repeat-containing protein [Verticillium alfalfae VaMs.102]|uniref:PC_rep repeat-containing protein n=1 Tax=Verticillium alfalfae (strain VaMs.102 / ATCC MYA-4576 / FGSC 10136) TaxID=526221 RepID=C9SFI9_VERA1|nr:PC_rep repeat-containing protein [Verticillium alfalfae VaMs.102]EEY17322.1 PC_rep repeat-containing protein [Verticillium alfalfae VaMs.102]